MTAAEHRFKSHTRHAGAAITLALFAALSGCAAPSLKASAPEPQAALPARWQAPLPHDGSVAELSNAKSRIEQARASRIGKGAALVPTVSASTGVSRGQQELNQPLLTSTSAGLQMAWEIDVFGADHAAASAAQSRLEGAQALWHDARVMVAAEVANAESVLGHLAL